MLRVLPVSMFLTTTAAPGTEDPEGSVTVPVIVPDAAVWAKAAAATRQTSRICPVRTAKTFRMLEKLLKFSLVKKTLKDTSVETPGQRGIYAPFKPPASDKMHSPRKIQRSITWLHKSACYK